MQLLDRQRRRFNSLYSPQRLMTSATVFSKNFDCMPVAPTEPISSLSTKMQQAVRAVSSSKASMACKEV